MTIEMEPDQPVEPREEPLDEGALPEQPAEEAEVHRYPSTIGGACYVGLLGLAIAGVVLAACGHWRSGVQMLAAALVCAALLRAVLRDVDAGMLAVRNRWLDVSLLLVAGGVLWFLAVTIPATS